MQPPLINLTDTVDHERRDHGGRVGDVVSKHALETNDKNGSELSAR